MRHKILGMAFLWVATASILQAQNISWSFATKGQVFSCPAIGSDDTIYFGSLDKRLYAVRSDGTKRWEFLTGNAIQGSPAIGADETIYVGSLDHKLYAVSPAGTQLWTFATSGAIKSSPAIGSDGVIYLSSMDHTLYAIEPDGTRRWAFSTGGELLSSPAIATDGTIYVGSFDHNLYAVNPDGTEQWRFSTGGAIRSSPVIGLNGTIYAASMDHKVYAVQPDGTKQWEFVTRNELYASPAIAPDGTIYVAAYDHRLYALRPDGHQIWEDVLPTRIEYSSPAIGSDGRIYVGAIDGNLYAMRSDGSNVWTAATGASIQYSSPAIGRDGTIYVGSNDRSLYAISGSGTLAAGIWPMFRRDLRHSAGGFVEREVPDVYSPGAPFDVFLHATPAPGVTSYTVEDSPPAGWQVSNISHHGQWDTGNGTVRFGPFLDAQPRTLSYTVTPPFGGSGQKQFRGSSTALGAERLVGGRQTLAFIPLHPADIQPVDARMTIAEVTAYGAAWKSGQSWLVDPSPIPVNYLDRAIDLWQEGEAYAWFGPSSLAPFWWDTSPPPSPTPEVLPPSTGATGTAAADMPRSYQAGQPLAISIQAAPDAGTLAYAVEDQVPAGWTVSNVDQGGIWDARQDKVKWGPFFDATPRALSYTTTAPGNAGGPVEFRGIAAFDDTAAAIARRTHVFSEGSITPPSVQVTPGTGGSWQLTLQGSPDEVYVIEASTDLSAWSPILTVTNQAGGITITDPDQGQYPYRFYRAVWP